ncbi:unnamed protein product, partial [Owenia fusiformis]
AENLMRELDQAAQIVLAPPNIVSNEQRHCAENLFLNFRKSKLPYSTCRELLEKSKNDYVLFQAASTIKESVVREWTLLQPDDIQSLRLFLLKYVVDHIDLKRYVRRQILQAVAVMSKRGALDGEKLNKDAIFNDVTQLISSGNLSMQLVACSILTSLLDEFSSTSKSSKIGLTWEFHSKCKRSFEDADLKKVFSFCLQVLHELEKCASPLNRDVTYLSIRFLTITEQLLNWQFSSRHPIRNRIGSFMIYGSVPFRPLETWQDVILDRGVLDLFFKIHEKVRHNSEMAHHSMQCISQLATLTGAVFSDDTAKRDYVAHFLQGFLALLASIDLQDYEALGVATTINNLLTMFSMGVFIELPKTLFEQFANALTQLTCRFGQAAALEEAMKGEDTLYREAYGKLLDSWMNFVTDVDNFAPEFWRTQSTEVFTSYLQSHLGPPDGTRNQTSSGEVNDDDNEDYDETEEDDRLKFKEDLCCIGVFARRNLGYTLPLLSKLLEGRIQRLHGQLQRMQQVSSPGNHVAMDTSMLSSLNEDLHWTLLIIANVITRDPEGETPMIPSEIMEHSIEQNKSIDLQTSLKVLASPGEDVATIPGADTSTDHIIRLISAVFKLCEVEKRAVAANLTHLLSPQVASTLMWLLWRWVPAFLLPDENYYAQISPAIQSAFGRDTEGGQWVMNFLLEKIVSNLSVWSSEESLILDTVQLFSMIVENKHRCSSAMKCPSVWQLAKEEAANQPPLSILPCSGKRHLLRALVLAGSASLEESVKQEYWKYILQSLHDRFKTTVCHENFKRISNDESVRNEVIGLLESLCGVAEATRVTNVSLLFNFLHPALVESVKLVDIYHTYVQVVQLILELFCEIAKRQICYLGLKDTKSMYDCCLQLLQTYAKHSAGKLNLNSNAEEEQYMDLLIVMELLTHLLSKDFIDFGVTEEEEASGQNDVLAADVVLYGLNIVIPLMNAELLKFPALCSQYFKLITYVGEIYPEKMCNLPEQLHKNLMASLELGFTSFGEDINKSCLDLLVSLGSHVAQSEPIGSQGHTAMTHFLEVMFTLLVTDSFDMDQLDTASSTFHALICCNQAKYNELVHHLISEQSEELYSKRLVDAFNELTPPGEKLSLERRAKIKFIERFEKFVLNVRGFLCVR